MRLQAWIMMVVALMLLGGCASSQGGAKAPMEPASQTRGDFGPNYASEPMAETVVSAQLSSEAEEVSGGAFFRGGLDFMSRGEDRRLAQKSPDPKPTTGAPPPTTPTKLTPDVPKPSPGGSDGATQIAGPLLIYTATFHMAVFEAGPSIDATYKLAKDMGGYLVRRDQHTIVVRVPAAKYRDALAQIGKLGDVLHREETVEDVTEQFLDVQTRLRNARAMRDRLEKLLQQAKDVKEALAVEKELGRITTDIERMEGRLKRLRELISFSTITVQFKPRPSDHVESKVRLPFPWLDRMGLSNLLSL
ncbi:MAG: DUF4349 domain-containing protein [Deltaproteobacteria bacterium]|nr:DUF4349 domain-containing protein [Deltaproteobacteria bacterium]